MNGTVVHIAKDRERTIPQHGTHRVLPLCAVCQYPTTTTPYAVAIVRGAKVADSRDGQ